MTASDCNKKSSSDPDAQPERKPSAKITPVTKKIGESDKNLEQRRDWFEKRTGKDDASH